MSDKTEKKSSLRQQYQESLKSLDTEEHIDLMFYRPIGFFWAKLAAKCHITPNVITIASIFIGIAAGISFYYNDIWVNVAGMLMLMLANSFDSADGQLARLTGQYSRLGRILDGMAGDTWFITIYVCICLREVVSSEFFIAHHWVIWTLAVVAGLSHIKQAQMADYYRQFHLYFLKGEDGSELDSTDVLKRNYRQLSWKRDFFGKIVGLFYLNYTLQQEKTTPAMQRLRRALRERFGKVSAIPMWFRNDFRTMSLPLMKYTNILSFNWRVITLFVSLFLRMPWIYFAVEIVIFNGLMIYMRNRHERLCRELLQRLETTTSPHEN